MALEDIVKFVVQSVSRAAAVEALKADIEASWLVLSTVILRGPKDFKSAKAYNRVKALSTVLPVYRLKRRWGTQV